MYYYCSKNRKIVKKECYKECLDKEYKIPKRLKKRSVKQNKIESKRYSIIQKDLNKCFYCNNKATDWHELLKGKNRRKAIQWGLCLRLCRKCHEKTENNVEFYKEGRVLAQKSWIDYYDKNLEGFIKEFGKSYKKDK